MSERPEYVKCISRGQATPGSHITWCDETVFDFLFVDVNHAAREIQRGGRLLICPECADAVVLWMQKGRWSPVEEDALAGVAEDSFDPGAVTARAVAALLDERDRLTDLLASESERADRAEAAGEFEGNSAQHWANKAKAYGGMARNAGPELARAGYPVDAHQDGGAVEGIRQSVAGLAAERDRLAARVAALEAEIAEQAHEIEALSRSLSDMNDVCVRLEVVEVAARPVRTQYAWAFPDLVAALDALDKERKP